VAAWKSAPNSARRSSSVKASRGWATFFDSLTPCAGERVISSDVTAKFMHDMSEFMWRRIEAGA